MGTSRSEAAILDFPLPVRSHNIMDTPIEYVDLENIDMAVVISYLSCLQAEIYVFKVKFRSGVRHLEFLFPIRSYSMPHVSV
jgi:hypothetical protein